MLYVQLYLLDGINSVEVLKKRKVKFKKISQTEFVATSTKRRKTTVITIRKRKTVGKVEKREKER